MSRSQLKPIQTNAQMRASANNLLEAHNISAVPINIYQILHDEEVPVDFVPFRSSKVEGIYLKNVTGVGIAINVNHSPVKRRFTGSHELKHHRHDVLADGQMLCSSDFSQSKIEQRANRFAAELLMPRHFVKSIWEELNQAELLTITAIARAFHVSYPATVFRLHRLEYISSAQRDKLLLPEEKQKDKHDALLQRANGNTAKLREPALVATLASSDGFSYCQVCSELVINTNWSICYSCGNRLD